MAAGSAGGTSTTFRGATFRQSEGPHERRDFRRGSVRAVYHPEFKVSFDAGIQYYQQIGPLLAARFKTEVKAGVKQLLSGMEKHAPGPHGFRCYRCQKFPYLVYYELSGDSVLFLAVIYVGREPGYLADSLWRHRT